MLENDEPPFGGMYVSLIKSSHIKLNSSIYTLSQIYKNTKIHTEDIFKKKKKKHLFLNVDTVGTVEISSC